METTATPLRLWALGGFLVLCTAAFAVLGNGHLGPIVVPALAVLILFAVAHLPLRYSVAGLVFVTLLVHNPGGRPMMDVWHGPLYTLGEAYYNNLRLLVNVGFLRFCTLEVLLAIITIVAILRVVGPRDRDTARTESVAYPMKVALLVALVTLLVWVMYGTAAGGQFKQLLWQTRQLGWLPIIAGLCILAFRTPEGLRTLGRTVVAVAVLRSLEGLYFYFAYVRPQGLDLAYLITHEDSVLFAVALAILFVSFYEEPTRQSFFRLAFLLPIIGFALLMNGRRLAYVSLAGGLAATWLLARPTVRRRLSRLFLVVSPLAITYIAVGWHSDHVLFRPVASLRSVGDENNASNQTRDIENDNLIYTLKRSPLIGTGFGHPYIERTHGPSIERFMGNYLYIAHNSVLWLWAMGGLLGFYLLWLPIPVMIFLAVRAYRRADDATDRIAALVTVCTAIAYMVQAYGDMGMTGWMGAFLLAAGLAASATLATRHGAAWQGRVMSWPVRPQVGPRATTAAPHAARVEGG